MLYSGVFNMDDFKKPYLILFNSLTDIAEEIEKQNYGRAKQLIEEVQQKAEGKEMPTMGWAVPEGGEAFGQARKDLDWIKR